MLWNMPQEHDAMLIRHSPMQERRDSARSGAEAKAYTSARERQRVENLDPQANGHSNSAIIGVRGGYVKISGSLGLGALPPITSESRAAPVAGAPNGKVDDSLTFSSEARSRAEAAAHPRFGALSVAAHGNAELADQLAYGYSHDPSQELVDLTDEIAGTGPVKYAATGQPVTAESEARFKQYASAFQAAARALYNEERAKGTSSADIFDKLVALGDAQPAEFRAMMDWEGLTAKRG